MRGITCCLLETALAQLWWCQGLELGIAIIYSNLKFRHRTCNSTYLRFKLSSLFPLTTWRTPQFYKIYRNLFILNGSRNCGNLELRLLLPLLSAVSSSWLTDPGLPMPGAPWCAVPQHVPLPSSCPLPNSLVCLIRALFLTGHALGPQGQCASLSCCKLWFAALISLCKMRSLQRRGPRQI